METTSPSSSSFAPRRKRASATQRASIIAKFEKSGLTQKAFCQKHGLCVATLANWRKKSQPSTGNKFLRLDFPGPAATMASIHFPNGLELRTAPGSDPTWVAACAQQLYQIRVR
jgi:hypothetical protein